jgi:hypothetical protein
MPRQPLILLVLGIALGAAALASYGVMAGRQAAAETAQADLQACLRDAAAIESLRHRPRLAADHERLATEVTGLVEQAARTAGIAPASLQRITPEAAQRLGDSAYLEKPTLLVLDGVTMEQLVRLIHTLVASQEGLHPKSVRLTAPRLAASDNTWAADVVLTYLLYEPVPIRETRKQP